MDIIADGYSLAGVPFVYWLLRSCLVLVMIYCGRKIANRDGSEFWKYAKWIVLFYTVVEGLRWGRGNDYYHYWYDVTKADFTVYSDPLYLWWIHIVRALDIPFVIPFSIYSCLLITGVTLVVKRFPKSAVWSYLLFEWLITVSAENFIRQYIGVAFILIAFYYYLNDGENKKVMMFAALITASLIHLSALLPVTLFLLFIYIPKIEKALIPWIYIGLYCVFFFLWDNSYLSEYVAYLTLLDSDVLGSFSSYVDNADRWFSDAGVLEDYAAASLVTSVMTFLRNLYVLYFGCKFAAIDKRYIVPFFFTFLSILIYIIGGGGNEMFVRFSHWHAVMLPIMMGCIIAYYPFEKKYGRYTGYLYMLYILYSFVRSFSLDVPCAFIWDVNVSIFQ